MFASFSKFVISGAIFAVAFFCLSLGISAQTQKADLSFACEWENIAQGEKSLSREDFRVLLEQCKKYYEGKSAQLEKEIGRTDKEKKTLAQAITTLKNKIKNLEYQVQQSNIMIKDLGLQIQNAESSIDKTGLKIQDVKTRLTNVLQLRHEEDQRSVVAIFLAEADLSDFFDNLVALEVLNLKTNELLKNIKNLKSDLETQKAVMDEEKKELENTVIIRTLQRKESAANQQEQENLLKLTEKEYQDYLKEKQDAQNKAAKIGQMLFELLQVPEGGIKLEDAVGIAKATSQETGVRAAFSLAILWQETKIGKLKGGCYLKNTQTGDGIYIKTGNVAPRTMKPTRDIPGFLSIIDELNKAGKMKTDALNTPVSCCMYQNGDLFGWGGAMGPSQFIPSTWMLYKAEIEQKTGDKPANPWDVRDAFLANGLYLRDLGAGAKTYQKELKAALRYFGCTSAWCQRNYGEPVMQVSNCFQTYIDKNLMSDACKDLIF